MANPCCTPGTQPPEERKAELLPVFRIFSLQTLSINLAAVVLRQAVLEYDAAWVFVHGQPPLDELLQLAGQLDALRKAFLRHDGCRALAHPALALKADHGAFTDGLVFEHTVFYFSRRDEDAADFQHLVGPPAVPEIAFGVTRELVARRAVIAGEGLFRFFVRLPVTDRGGIAFDTQRAHLPVGQRPSVGADDLGLVAGHNLAQTAFAHVAEAVRNVNVKHLRRPHAVEDFNSEDLFPAAIKLRRESLARRNADAQAAQIAFARARRVEHRVDHCRYVGQHGRAVTLDHFKQFFRRRPIGEQGRLRAHREREEQIRARGVTEEELRDRDGHVVLAHTQNLFRVTLGIVWQVVLQVNGGFRLTGRTGGKEPDRRVVAMRVGGLEFVEHLRRESFVMLELARFGAGDQNVLQIFGPSNYRTQAFDQRFVDDEDFRASVIEIVGVIFGGEQRIDHRDHRADFGRAEPERDELRAVGQGEQHTVFDSGAQFTQQMSRLVRLLHDLGVSPPLVAKPQTDFIAATRSQIAVEKIFGHVETLGKHRHIYTNSIDPEPTTGVTGITGKSNKDKPPRDLRGPRG